MFSAKPKKLLHNLHSGHLQQANMNVNNKTQQKQHKIKSRICSQFIKISSPWNYSSIVISGFRHIVSEIFALLRVSHSVHRKLYTDVKGQPIGSIFEGQAVQEECREHLATPFIKGMMWVVAGSQTAQW